ncbi:hypothetical protein A2685_00885 [Candidatus Woesebacteria bacterium RIFCSPHIGHO2_01_FULL_37_10]|uniref:Methionyl-tRNA formyltransferase n=1 Tax=Candidatus Woesebacteria bacterium RIFCSPHIGHO2_01_FULL_37_10 TaxID=1802489 RepID=A0A1F7XSI9_9BACT|nr:MAG: hypothetical protein A2685_00885 [Candidatus Woesebacteria bacterium RIFCSPHIGHO2_01_FULL_37_10]
MRIIFFGTPEYVLPILEMLHKAFRDKIGKSSGIAAVVTQEPKIAGRDKFLAYSPVDTWAHKHKIPKFHNPSELVEKEISADIGVLASYGKIIPKKVLNHFPFGIINIHPSLLPKFRGASPVQASLISGENQTGVTFIKLDEELDHGPIISQFKEEIQMADTTESLRNRLFERSAEVLKTLLPAYLQGKIKPTPQDDKEASFTRQLKKEDGFIDPKAIKAAMQGKNSKKKRKIPFIKNYSLVPSAYSLEGFIRAMQPWPVAWTHINLGKGQELKGKRLKILKAHIDTKDAIRKTQYERSNNTSPVSRIPYLVMDEVQLEGKNSVTWKQLLEGYPEARLV